MASPVVGAQPKYPYAAFISYNRGADLQLSADLQSALQQFAKPWYRLRALRVFRDVAVLSANAAAWPAVAKALDESEYLILLASPEAAASVWCKKEIEHWLATRPREKILLAITGGDIAWDQEAGDFDWSRTTALPADVLRGKFTVEPNYIDLRPVKAAAGSARSKVLRALVADLAAPLHHRPKDDLVGEEFRVRRRARLLAGSAIVALIGLTVAAGFFAVEARVQANTAEQRRAQAEEQRRLATARQLAAQSQLVATSDARTALRLGLAADTLAPGPETQANLVSLLASTSYAGELGDHKKGAVAALFTPDGHTLVTADLQGGIFLWDATDVAHPRRLGALPGKRTSFVTSPVFHRDGHTLAFSSDTNVELWDLADPANPRQLGDPLMKAGASVMFSPDGRLMVTDGRMDKAAEAWDVSDLAHPRPISELSVDDGGPLALMPDGRTLVWINAAQEVSLWDVTDIAHPRPLGVRLDVKNQHYPNEIVVSPDGRTMAAVDTIHGTRLYDVSNPRQPRLLGVPLPDLGPEVAFSPDSQRLAASTTNKDVVLLNLLDREHPTQIGGVLAGHFQTVWQVNFSPDGRTLVTASADGRVDLWTLASRGQRLGPPVAGGGWSVAVSPQGTVLATDDRDDTLRLFDLTDPTRPRAIGTADGFLAPESVLSFSADGQLLAVGADIERTFRLYDVSDPSRPRRLASPPETRGYSVKGVAFSPKGRLLAVGTTEGAVNLWDVADPTHPRQVGKALERPDPYASVDYVQAVAFSSDGQTVAVAYSNFTLALWDVADPARPRRLSTLTGHTDHADTLAFSPDGTLLASAGHDATMRLWDVRDRSHPLQIGLPVSSDGGVISTVVISPDGHTVAASVRDRGVLTWDVTDPAHPHQLGAALVGQIDSGYGAVFSHDGRVLISNSLDGTLVVWDYSWATPLRSNAHQLACTYADGGLDRPQWALYAGGLEYVDSCRG